MNNTSFDTYDFVINDEDEALLLLYARQTIPQNPMFTVDFDAGNATLTRNPEDTVNLSGIPSEVLDSLKESDKLLVCELSLEEDEKNTQIVYAYEAEISD